MKTDECLFKNVIMNVSIVKRQVYQKTCSCHQPLKILEVRGLAFSKETDRNLCPDTLPQI
jgi:hypothetical protein